MYHSTFQIRVVSSPSANKSNIRRRQHVAVFPFIRTNITLTNALIELPRTSAKTYTRRRLANKLCICKRKTTSKLSVTQSLHNLLPNPKRSYLYRLREHRSSHGLAEIDTAVRMPSGGRPLAKAHLVRSRSLLSQLVRSNPSLRPAHDFEIVHLLLTNFTSRTITRSTAILPEHQCLHPLSR